MATTFQEAWSLAGVKATDHVRGNLATAKVVLIEYADYQCGFCVNHYATMLKLLDRYGDQVAWVYRHYPLPKHAEAISAAVAAECAGQQGKFWEYSDMLFAGHDKLGLDYYVELAENLGLNTTTFAACAEDERPTGKIIADVISGRNAGVTSTPTTFVNGRLVSGALPLQSFVEMINAELEQAR